MMDLTTQIYTFLFSCLYGLLFFGIIDIIKNHIIKYRLFIQVFFSLVFSLAMALLYFYILVKINDGIIHIYYLLAFLIGYYMEILSIKLFKRIVLLIKKWYNLLGG